MEASAPSAGSVEVALAMAPSDPVRRKRAMQRWQGENEKRTFATVIVVKCDVDPANAVVVE